MDQTKMKLRRAPLKNTFLMKRSKRFMLTCLPVTAAVIVLYAVKMFS